MTVVDKTVVASSLQDPQQLSVVLRADNPGDLPDFSSPTSWPDCVTILCRCCLAWNPNILTRKYQSCKVLMMILCSSVCLKHLNYCYNRMFTSSTHTHTLTHTHTHIHRHIQQRVDLIVWVLYSWLSHWQQYNILLCVTSLNTSARLVLPEPENDRFRAEYFCSRPKSGSISTRLKIVRSSNAPQTHGLSFVAIAATKCFIVV